MSNEQPKIVDEQVWRRAAEHLRSRGVTLPLLSELAEPARLAERMPAGLSERLPDIDPDAADTGNLFRVHWHNTRDRRGVADIPEHVVLPPGLTGVDSPIAVVLGDCFPLIGAHKVLAAYACLVPRLTSGEFDPTRQRAIWPSTGNYCRGGVAISSLLGCRGVAVLPEGMSAERFEWLARWVGHPDDIVRTPGSESNVKEIYDACDELSKDPDNVIFNQFSEYGNHLVHYAVTGSALARVFEHYRGADPGNAGARLAAFVSATGSAGTIGAGDYLKERYGSSIVAVEALECPTMLENGFGEHNIQGIGDKHIPLIHNVMNTDVVVAISDIATDSLNVLFNTDVGREWLARELDLSADLIDVLSHFGLSSICNVLAAIKTARKLGTGKDDVFVTVATDGAAMYRSEAERTTRVKFAGTFDSDTAAGVYREHIAQASADHTLVLDDRQKRRIFNLGYFTWVEQRGVSVADFEARRSQSFWRDLRAMLPAWDEAIAAMNREIGQ